jgi:UDP-2,3-diacylglucosamine pyrophosphatase LpxH
MNTLVISDIHLGSAVSQKEHVLHVLNLDFKRLIINGDLFDSYSFKRFDKKDWAVLSKIRKLSKSHEVILVYGNHDSDAQFLSAITGMDFVENYLMIVGGKRIYFEHGDRFDHWIKHRPFITWFFTGAYYWVQKFDKNHNASRMLKRMSKSWIKAKDIVRKKFVERHGCKNDILVAGHTHYPEVVHLDNCSYINTGSFCEDRCSYLEIYDDGSFELKYTH